MMRLKECFVIGVITMALFTLYTPKPVSAEDFICSNGTVLVWYAHSIDPSKTLPCVTPATRVQISEENIASQFVLFNSLPRQYIKVVGGLMVEMTQAEKDVVDAPRLAKEAAALLAKDEVTTNEVCANHTLAEINTYWSGKQATLQGSIATLDTAIAAVGAGTAKTALTAARDAMVAHMNMFVDGSRLLWRYICSRTVVRP